MQTPIRCDYVPAVEGKGSAIQVKGKGYKENRLSPPSETLSSDSTKPAKPKFKFTRRKRQEMPDVKLCLDTLEELLNEEKVPQSEWLGECRAFYIKKGKARLSNEYWDKPIRLRSSWKKRHSPGMYSKLPMVSNESAMSHAQFTRSG